MPNPTRDALIIAITQYSDLPMPPEMRQLADGAEQIAQRLETQGGFRVTRLPVTKPGDKEFIDPEKMVMVNELELAIEQLLIPKSDTPPTTALIYFAGHGLQKEIKADRYEGFLATSYANPNEDEWGVSLQWLRQLLEKSPVQQQIVWIDACHSGELFNFTTSDRVHDRGFISSARPHEEAYAEGLLTKALLETLDYTQQLNPWVDHLTLIEKLQAKNQTAPGAQRFQFEKTDKPILLTNKAFDLEADYKNLCPFKGLESFDFEKNPDDPLYFKGRTELTHELLEKVQTANFLAVFGASGNGKSSVVRAGLLYKLQQTQTWRILPVMTPTADPLKALGTLIGMPAAQLSDFIKQAQTERLVLVIDQFEEIFTLCKNDAQREQFFELLLTAVEQTDNQFSLIIVMRADFLDKCSHHVDLAKKIQAHQVIVTPMTAAELEEAIVAPTQQVGLQIEQKLVSEMLADIKGALGSLPLLQYTLKELWKTCATQRLLTYSAYEGLGKIAGTLEQGANGVYENLSPAEQKTAQRIFIELTQLGEGSPDTRRQLSQQDLVTSLPFESAPVNQVIQKLVAANLVVTDKPKEEQVAIVNIAHEALIQHWGQLGGWLDGNRDAIKIQRDTEADAKKFQDSNQSKNALLQGLDLNIAKDYAKKHTEKVSLSTLAQDFVKRSVKGQRHYWMGVIGAVVGVMLVLAGIAFYANEQRIVADEQRIEAENQRQVAQTQQKLADEQRIEADNQRQFAQKQQKLAENESQRAKQERDSALRTQSLFLADLAHQQNEQDNATNSILLALEALPKDILSPDRPYVLQVHDKLYQALLNYSEFQVFKWHNDGWPRNPAPTFSPDGKIVLTVSSDYAQLWDVDSGKLLKIFAGNEGDILNAALSSDGKTLITSSYDNDAHLWDVNSGKIKKTFKGVGNDQLEFSPDDKIVLTAQEETIYETFNIFMSTSTTVRLWDANSGKLSTTLKGYKDDIDYVVFSPNSKIVITNSTRNSSNHTVYLWDTYTGILLKPLVHEDNITHAVFSPDGKIILTTSWDKTASLWDVNSGKVLKILAGHEDYVNYAEFSPNGKTVLTASSDNTARLWNIDNGKALKILTGHKGVVNHAVFSPDGKVVLTASSDKTARLWDVDSGKTLKTFAGHEDNVYHTAFSPDGKMALTASKDKTVRLWQTVHFGSKYLKILRGHNSGVSKAIFSPDGKTVLTASSDKTARLWDAYTGKLLRILTGHGDPIVHVTFSHDGKTIITTSGEVNPDESIPGLFYTNDATARLWDVHTGKLLKILRKDMSISSILDNDVGMRGSVLYAEFSPDDKIVVTASLDKRPRLWNAHTGKYLKKLWHGDNSFVTHAKFSPDGKTVLTASSDGTANLWDVHGNIYTSLIKTFEHKDMIWRVAFSPDGKTVLTASVNKNIILWDIDSGEVLKKFAGYIHAEFSSDGKMVLTVSKDKAAYLWDVHTGKLLQTFTGHTENVVYATFSPDSKTVLTASVDNTARLWDINSGKTLKRFMHKDVVNHAVFSPNGKIVLTASDDNTARLWDISFTIQDLIDHANQVVPRCLSPEQREQFFLPSDPSYILIEEGEQLAKQGNITAATAKFKEAKTMAPCHKFLNYSETKAREIAATPIVEKGAK
ncbi:MAG: caspase family protein [Candidatus Parabeggiatoa sp.]|nr:caspase family protein [Candidatus Parabeggiatoa sp.]